MCGVLQQITYMLKNKNKMTTKNPITKQIDKSQLQEISISEALSNKIIALVQQRENANKGIEDAILTILEAKEIDYNNKDVDMSEDFKKIIITKK